MLPQAQRVPASDISVVLKQGKRRHFAGFTVVYKQKEGDSRFAFIVSTKVDKRAVVRNRVRRILQEVVRLHLDHFPLHADVVLVAQQAAVGLTKDDIEAQILPTPV